MLAGCPVLQSLISTYTAFQSLLTFSNGLLLMFDGFEGGVDFSTVLRSVKRLLAWPHTVVVRGCLVCSFVTVSETGVSIWQLIVWS